jgi:hypothetical protein
MVAEREEIRRKASDRAKTAPGRGERTQRLFPAFLENLSEALWEQVREPEGHLCRTGNVKAVFLQKVRVHEQTRTCLVMDTKPVDNEGQVEAKRQNNRRIGVAFPTVAVPFRTTSRSTSASWARRRPADKARTETSPLWNP